MSDVRYFYFDPFDNLAPRHSVNVWDVKSKALIQVVYNTVSSRSSLPFCDRPSCSHDNSNIQWDSKRELPKPPKKTQDTLLFQPCPIVDFSPL